MQSNRRLSPMVVHTFGFLRSILVITYGIFDCDVLQKQITAFLGNASGVYKKQIVVTLC